MNPSIIIFYDACFGLDTVWRKNFFKELIKLKPKNYFWIETRPELLDEEDINLLSQLKIKVDFGIESFSEDMLKIMNKTKKPNEYLKKFLYLNKLFNKKKIIHQVFLILNHPGETLKTMTQSYDFIKKNITRFEGGYLNIGYQPYSLFLGSEVYKNIDCYTKKYGTKIYFKEWWKMDVDQNLLSRKILPSADFLEKETQMKQKDFLELIDLINSKSKFDFGDFFRKYYD